MKKLMFSIFAALLTAGFVFKSIMISNVEDLMKRIDILDEEAREMVFSNISGPAFYIPDPMDLKNSSEEEKVSMVSIVGNYVKNYTESDEFLNNYLEYRESVKPNPPESPESMDDIQKQQVNDIKNSIKEMEQLKSSLPEDQKKIYDETINFLKEQLKAVQNQDESFNEEMDKYAALDHEQQMKNYEVELAKWETEYPENPDAVIKRWINKFLDETKDIDFGADLYTTDNGKRIFVKKEYEDKSDLWKLCFRSGKETTEAGRKFAQNWLNELAN